MTLKEKIRFHQIHPFKFSVDIISAFTSIYFYWQHSLIIGILIGFIFPLLASFIAIRFFDIEYLKTSPLGNYAQKHLTTTVTTIKFLTNFIMLSGAWYHSLIITIAGIAILIGCWCWGLVLEHLAA